MDKVKQFLRLSNLEEAIKARLISLVGHERVYNSFIVSSETIFDEYWYFTIDEINVTRSAGGISSDAKIRVNGHIPFVFERDNFIISPRVSEIREEIITDLVLNQTFSTNDKRNVTENNYTLHDVNSVMEVSTYTDAVKNPYFVMVEITFMLKNLRATTC